MNKKKFKNKGMVDVTAKASTKRTAAAVAKITMNPETFRILTTQGSPKGDVFETARVAGILAAKSTWAIIPLCHPLALGKISIDMTAHPSLHSIKISAEVVCVGQTGVEMEALTAASVTALTIYDMMKWSDPHMVISDVVLLKKTGGQSGNFLRKT